MLQTQVYHCYSDRMDVALSNGDRKSLRGISPWIGRQCTGIRNALTNEVLMSVEPNVPNTTNTTAPWLMVVDYIGLIETKMDPLLRACTTTRDMSRS